MLRLLICALVFDAFFISELSAYSLMLSQVMMVFSLSPWSNSYQGSGIHARVEKRSKRRLEALYT